MLASAQDRRAIPVLRDALGARNHATVIAAVNGLAALNDRDAVPLISGVLARLRPKIAQSVAAAAAEFDDPRIGPILDRYVTDPNLRKELDARMRSRRTLKQ